VKKSLISIIIPTYNRLLPLAELMESLDRQSLQDFEIIIVNDCGGQVDILKDVYPNLNMTIIDLEKNSGHVQARNEGIRSSKGELILLMDDDDLLVPSHLENMIREIEDTDLVYSDVEIVHYRWEKNIRVPVERSLFAYELDLEAMRRFSSFVPSGCLYRKELHQKIGLFDAEVHNYWDWDFFLRVSDRFRVKRVASAGVLYDFSDSNNNQSKNADTRRVFLNRLSEKHQLGYLPVKNFQQLLGEAEVMKRKAESKILWDGKPFISRLAQSLS
jgi:glycosyltransferase involved in cell wall biosynthesis